LTLLLHTLVHRVENDSPDFFDVPEGHRSGYAALVGRPNAGKSTLMNALVGRKLSIVTNKPQTTRHRVLGLLSSDDYQIVLLDTPGVLEPKYGLQKRMMDVVGQTLDEADVVLFLADATKPLDTFTLERLTGRPVVLVLTKIDLVEQAEAVEKVAAYAAAFPFEAVVPVSATEGFNLERVVQEVLDRMPVGPPFFPKDQISEHPERFFVGEIVREKIFQHFREEVPYATTVNIVQYVERVPPEKDLIDAEIVVERDTQKAILIGKGGAALKKIGTAARRDIERFLDRPVFLRLFVKVRDDWRNRDTFLDSYGY